MKQQHINEIKAILVLAIGAILLGSLASFSTQDLAWYTSTPNIPAKNLIGIWGAYLAGILFFVFGYSCYALVVFAFFWSWNKFASRDLSFSPSKFISFAVFFCVLSSLLSMLGPQTSALRFLRGGVVGLTFSDFLVQNIGWTGAYIFLITLTALTLVITSEFLISPVILKIPDVAKDLADWLHQKFLDEKEKLVTVKAKVKTLGPKPFKTTLPPRLNKELEEKTKSQPTPVFRSGQTAQEPPKKPELSQPPKPSQPKISIVAPIEKEDTAALKAKQEKPKVVGTYRLPGLDLLNDPPPVSTNKIQEDLSAVARILEETLADFGVTVRVDDIERGPVITRYELEPAPGVKVGKITTLTDDIALALRAPSVRIVAPIPGKNRVGIEVPNGASTAVYLKDVLAKSNFRETGSKLMLALGKDIAGQSLIADLAEMPHLLIAGTTGSGKTVCVNSIIMSMLFNASPDEVKFLMVDPKMVELACYNELPHCLCPAVTDAKKVSAALNWVVGEMEARYNTLKDAGVRNIKGYQEKGNKMPYIVVIIDELADLMQVAAKTVESSITRLAQLSRAVGIHLILATQRPSVDVITGVIKANFPARISFKVASKVDSRTVLDMNGAENLLGKGDLLFMKPGEAKPIRGQCSFVSDGEIQKVINFIKEQQAPVYDETILKQSAGGASGGGNEEADELYDEAVKLVIETNQASVSILQRRMRLGYTRAARLIDMMEQHGLVGPYCGSKPRDILVNREEWLMQNMNPEKKNG